MVVMVVGRVSVGGEMGAAGVGVGRVEMVVMVVRAVGTGRVERRVWRRGRGVVPVCLDHHGFAGGVVVVVVWGVEERVDGHAALSGGRHVAGVGVEGLHGGCCVIDLGG